jgi:hypothetical protein
MHCSRTFASLSVSVALAGCGTSDPNESSSTWVLESVAGQEMPARIHDDESPLLVLSDTLYFDVHDSDFRGPLVRSVRWIGLPDGPPSRGNTLFHYDRVADQITIRVTCPPNADCLVDERHGEFSADLLSLAHAPSAYGRPFRSPLVYQRVH